MQRTKDFLKVFNFTQPKQSYVKRFYDFDAARYEKLLEREKSQVWEREGEKKALRLFKAAAVSVPAYKDFLKKHGVKAANIKSIKDFSKVPLTTKENYINKYPVAARCWNGSLGKQALIAISSGTSGEPKFWPRSDFQEFEAAVIHEVLYRRLFQIHKRKTLLIIGFPMGMYVSGMAETLSSWLVSTKGYDLTLVTIGNHKADVLRAMEYLAGDYDQVILEGHPFFIKDVLETAKSLGLAPHKKLLGLLFCSEGYTEGWRDYVLGQAASAHAEVTAYSTYGSSEMLLMGYETPLTVQARKAMGEEASAVPNLFQYNPLERYIEQVGQELVFTSNSGIPLIRFNLHDSGVVYPYETFAKMAKSLGVKQAAATPTWKLPVVALRGRSDNTLVFYAANIYPEHIHIALNHKKFLPLVTGKFSMRKNYKRNMDQFMEIHVELKPGVKPAKKTKKAMQDHIINTLQEVNAEYLFLRKYLEKDIKPRIVLWPYQHETYFKPGVKPKYVIKS